MHLRVPVTVATTLADLANCAPAARGLECRQEKYPGLGDKIVEVIPNSATCNASNDQCRTGYQAAQFIGDAMNYYQISRGFEQGGVLALIGYESVDLQYKINLNPANAASGQGTSNMQQGTFNVEFANSRPELKAKNPTTSTVLDLVTADQYNFATGFWYYSTKCTEAQTTADNFGDLPTASQADEWFQQYMSCVGVSTSAQPTRLDYWKRAKAAMNIS